jgi:hypothetical protein
VSADEEQLIEVPIERFAEQYISVIFLRTAKRMFVMLLLYWLVLVIFSILGILKVAGSAIKLIPTPSLALAGSILMALFSNLPPLPKVICGKVPGTVLTSPLWHKEAAACLAKERLVWTALLVSASASTLLGVILFGFALSATSDALLGLFAGSCMWSFVVGTYFHVHAFLELRKSRKPLIGKAAMELLELQLPGADRKGDSNTE